MEDNDYVMAFDHFYTNNHIQILKSVIPFINAETATMLPVMIKYLELKYTLSLINSNKNINASSSNVHLSSIDSDNQPSANQAIGNIENIYNAIRRYLAPDEDKSISQIVNAMRTMKNVREMQAMLDMLDINMGELGGNGFDINEIMKMFGGNINGN